MKRREFLMTPALGTLLPTALNNLDPFHSDSIEQPQSAADWRKFRQRLHQDFETYVPGVEYFILGNGDIQAVVQYMPDRSDERPMTYLGLTLMDSERFARKWSTFLFHPERGFERSMMSVALGGKSYAPTPETFKEISWRYPDGVPAVTLEWTAGACAVREEFAVPSEMKYLFRRVFLTNTSTDAIDPKVFLQLVPSFTMFDEIGINEKERSVEAIGFAFMKLYALEKEVATAGRYDLIVTPGPLAPAATREIVFVYQLEPGKGSITMEKYRAQWRATSRYWAAKHSLVTGDPLLDHLFATSRSGLKAHLSRTGKRDSGMWMYNMEWVRDDMMVMLGLLHAGFFHEARTLLIKTLERSVGADGRTIESSRWFGYELTEIDQNGELLYGIWAYFCWTGDRELVNKYWKRISSVADFPIQEFFWDKSAKMLHSKREFWERGGDGFGVEDGFELTYQFWVAIGLEKIAEVAGVLGDRAAAKRWIAAARDMRSGMLEDPTYRLVENGVLIKRRTRDGRWQRYMIPANRASMPPGSPIATNEKPECDPDTASALPIAFEMVDPQSDLARATLQSLESLWNQHWTIGGYSRYNTSSEPDPPAPWALTTIFMARAYVEAGNDEKVWRALRWLGDIHGGKAGAWFERYGPSITPPAPPVCIIGWPWAEMSMLFVHHIAGIRPGIDRLVIRPRLIKGISTLRTTQTVRAADIELTVRTGAGKQRAAVNGKKVEMKDGKMEIPYPKPGVTEKIEIELE